jgi:catechol 2,3-dioxygenase
MIGRVRLRVADADGVRSYYERTIGLRADGLSLGVNGSPLIELIDDPSAPPAPPGSTGLFHLALLVPDRPALAQAVRRVVQSGARFTGASDHFVSEALYLRDPGATGSRSTATGRARSGSTSRTASCAWAPSGSTSTP